MSRPPALKALLPLLLLSSQALGPQVLADDEAGDDPSEETDSAPTPAQQEAFGKERAKKADSSFDAIMHSNEAAPAAAEPSARPPPLAPMKAAPSEIVAGALKETRGDADGDDAVSLPRGGSNSTASVPLDRYLNLREQLDQLARKQARPEAPPVTLGAADYRGQEKHQALALTATLSVTLGAPGRWKTVPLLGADAVVISARSGATPIPITTRDGFHVWVTQETGEKTLTLEILAPARGPRGSIEYDLVVDRTPVTHFSCAFPLAGLEPRLDDAVHAEVVAGRDSTTLDAAVKPTTRLHLVGFRDLGEGASANARVYAETLNLLSVEEASIDVFSVIRYTILYGGTKDFQVLVPPGIQVVSADGEGAFRYTLDKREDGTLLKGETAFPIRNGYEISLRLHRDTPRSVGSNSGESFQAPLPRSLNVEREDGWLGVEVPGKMRLEEASRAQALAVDVRQLPEEMVESAVTPILLAYRYQADQARVELKASRLPERAPSGASIDRIRATSVQAPEGRLLTELKISLRNRLRHSLSLELPEGSRLLSTLLDGQPVKPSRDETGHLLLPLRRSAGADRARPFVLQVVLEREGNAFGAFGRPELVLPSFDLPVSSLVWTVYLPTSNTYGELTSDVDAQHLAGEGTWTLSAVPSPSGNAAPGPSAPGGHGADEPPGSEGAGSADTGAMPVRIKLPESGVRLEYSRFWLEPDQPLKLRFWYARSSLVAPLYTLAALLFLWAAAAWAVRRGALAAGRSMVAGWRTLPSRLGVWSTTGGERTRVQLAGRWLTGLAALWVFGHLTSSALKLAVLLFHPL